MRLGTLPTSRRSPILVGATCLLALALAAQAAVAASPGSLDPTYGTNGTAALRVEGNDLTLRAIGLIRGPRGVVVLSQATFDAVAAEESAGYRLDGLTSAGRRDPGFNGGRPVRSAYVSTGLPSAIGVRPGGFFVIGLGNDAPGISYIRVDAFTWAGQRDPSFRGASFIVDYPGGAGLPHGTALADGRIRVCFQVTRPSDELEAGPWLLGLTATGAPDVTVGPNGVRRLGMGVARTCDDIIADAAGRLVVVGNGTWASGPLVIGRFSAAGEPDASFGNGGHRALEWSTRLFRGHHVLRFGTRYIVGGEARDKAAGSPYIAFTARFRADGSVDSDYGYGGVYRYPGAPGSFLRAMDVAGNARLVLGIARSGPSGTTETLSRVLATTGRVDGAFGRNGTVAVPYAAADSVVDSSLRTISAGTRSSATVLVQRRYP